MPLPEPTGKNDARPALPKLPRDSRFGTGHGESDAARRHSGAGPREQGRQLENKSNSQTSQ